MYRIIRSAMVPAGIAAILLLAQALPGAVAKSAPNGQPFLELRAKIDQVDQRIAALEVDIAECLRVEGVGFINGLPGPHLIVEGCNLHVRNGLGDTQTTNGRGNLIIGYNEIPSDEGVVRVPPGSHNVVIGPEHNYASYGGLVAGEANHVLGDNASVIGGRANRATGTWSSVVSGQNNEARGTSSSVTGGNSNLASGHNASVSGGTLNVASGFQTSVSGGRRNEASSGDPEEPVPDASVCGGSDNVAVGSASVVVGGQNSTASHRYSVVVGGLGTSTTADHDIAP